MKKSVEKILILLLMIILVFTIANFSYAAEGTISVPSVTVGQDFTVTVNIPQEAVAYEGKISITFSDGSVQNSKKLVVTTGVTGDFAHPGNMTASFKATKEGNATIAVTGLVISSKTDKINQNETLTKTINIASNKPAEPNWTNTGDTVYALENLNVRKSWDSSSEAIGSISKDASTKRIAVGSNGWDKIEYNGSVGYVLSKYLTTQKLQQNPPENPSNDSNNNSNNTNNEPTWRETGDTVYALEILNVRKSWNSSADKIGSLSKNSSTKRIAVGSNGWDKIEYNGTVGYVVSKYLTTQKPDEEKDEPTWTETGDIVYSLANLNVRKSWDASSEAIGSLNKGDSTKRIAVGSNGWDKIEYYDDIAYVMSKYLTTEETEEDDTENEINNNIENNTVENTNIVNNTVNQAELYNDIVDEIGVIPPVGRSIVDYIFIVAIFISIGMVAFVGIKIRENSKE